MKYAGLIRIWKILRTGRTGNKIYMQELIRSSKLFLLRQWEKTAVKFMHPDDLKIGSWQRRLSYPQRRGIQNSSKTLDSRSHGNDEKSIRDKEIIFW